MQGLAGSQSMSEWRGTMQAMGGKPVQIAGTRKRKLRSRGHAKKWIAFSGVDGLAAVKEAHLELLELTNRDDLAGAAEEDDDYGAEKSGGAASGGTASSSRGRGGRKRAKRSGGTTKRAAFDQRKCPPNFGSLANVLLRGLSDDSTTAYVVQLASQPARPARRFCCIKGVPAKYRDPASGLSFASKRAFSMIKEQPPPWVKVTANTPHFDALRLVRGQHAQR